MGANNDYTLYSDDQEVIDVDPEVETTELSQLNTDAGDMSTDSGAQGGASAGGSTAGAQGVATHDASQSLATGTHDEPAADYTAEANQWTPENAGGGDEDNAESNDNDSEDNEAEDNEADGADGKVQDTVPQDQKKVQDTVPQEQEASAGGTGFMGYDSQIENLLKEAEKYEPETDEQRKKRERKERSKKIIAAISDGLGALSNLFFTSQYAPNMYNYEKQSALTPLEARLQREKKEREDRDKYHLNLVLQAAHAQNEKAKTLREMEALAENQRIARAKEAREEDKHQGWMRYYGLKADGEELKNEGQAEKNRGYKADSDLKEIKTENEPRNQDDKHNEAVSRINKNNRTGNGRSGSGGRGRGGHDEVTVVEEYDPNGKLKKTKKTTKNNGKGTSKSKSWSLKD